MGLFNSSKLHVKKKVEGDSIHIFANYYKQRNKSNIKSSLIRDLIGTDFCLIVIDTKFILKSNSTGVTKDIQDLTEFLDTQSISYNKITTTRNADYNIFGITVKMGDKKKVMDYIIGFVVSVEEFNRLDTIIDKYNAFYYADISNSGPEELMTMFDSSKGEMEQLSELFQYSIFNDNFICQIGINTKEDRTASVEEILKNYR